MNLHVITIKPYVDKKIILILTGFVITAVGLTMAQDFIYTNFNQSAFYFSESFLFSCFWWLFLPLLYGQWILICRSATAHLSMGVIISLCLIAMHLFTYPLFVWLISNLFYHHTFEYQQTLRYALSEYLFLLIGIYIVLPISNWVLVKKITSPEVTKNHVSINTESFVETTLMVHEGKMIIPMIVSRISHFTANTPYVNIHVGHKKYLHHETLKSIVNKLDPDQFVRIHKSAIVNLHHVQSYTSRLNGDYDMLMADGTTLRVSRNYATAFKKKFKASHPLKVK